MDWTHFFAQALSTGPGQIIIGILLLILGPTALLSEKVFKEKFGAIGALLRWNKNRRERKAREKQDVTERQMEDLRNEIHRVDEARKKDNAELSAHITRLEIRTNQQHGYILWVTDKWWSLELWAAERGLELPPPPFMTYTEWTEKNKEAGGE